MRLILIPLLCLATAGCGEGQKSDFLCKVFPSETEMVGKPISGVRYFPEKFGETTQSCSIFGRRRCLPIVSENREQWYTRFWQAADESSLFETSQTTDNQAHSTIRFTWLRSFDHPIIIRFETEEGKTKIIATELSGQGGYEAGEIARVENRILTGGEVERFSKLSTALVDLPATICDQGLDGASWIVESAKPQDYRFIDRWTPQEGPVREFGLLAIELSGLDIPEDEIY